MQPINFDEIDEEEKSFTPLPEGKYVLTVEQCEEKRSDKGNEFWSLEFSVEGHDKRKIWDSLFFTEKTMNRVKKYFKCLGAKAEGTYTPVPVDLIGRSFKADLIITDYIDKQGNTKQKNEINIWGSEPIEKKKSNIVGEEEIPF